MAQREVRRWSKDKAATGTDPTPVDLDSYRRKSEPAPATTTASGLTVELPDPPGYNPYPATAQPTPTAEEDERRPILPPAIHRTNLPDTAKRLAGRLVHQAAYHGLRVLWGQYPALFAWYALRGAFRLFRRWLEWLVDSRSAFVEQNIVAGIKQGAVSKEEAREFKAARSTGYSATKRNAIITAAWLVAALLVALLLYGYGYGWMLWAVPPALLATLIYHGRPFGKPFVGPAVVPPRYRELTGDAVVRAYQAAGLHKADPVKYPDQQIAYMLGRDGAGSRVVVDLPWGLGLDDAIGARAKIASGLDVTVSQVFISRDPTSQRRHVLWVADRDPLAIPAGATPLLDLKPRDIWEPMPLGLDERGQLVTVLLLWAAFLVGAQPRQGKTFFARHLGLFCALDPYVKISVFDPSGKPDWRKFALIADQCAFGLVRTKAGDPIEIVLHALRAIKADVLDRYERLSQMPVEVCPEGKLTRDIARNPKYRMPVHVVFLEEIQELFNLGEASKEIGELLVFLVKVAPGAGVVLVSSTQRPSGIGTTGALATAFINYRDNHTVRFSLKTGAWQVSDAVLGAGAYTEGFDSSTLLPSHKGCGILRGASDATPTVRGYLADGEDAEKILIAARALRERAGTLTGQAAGEEMPVMIRDVLGDALGMFNLSEDGLTWVELAGRLAEQVPERWADATPEAVSAQVRGFDVDSVNIRRAGNQKGCRRSDVAAAIERRDGK